MSLSITVDTDDPTPHYEQLRRQIAALIESGALEPSTRLPSVRQLAGDLRLAPGTVARTYKSLEEAGLVQTRRGGGTTVAALRSRADDRDRRRIDDAAARFVAAARRLGAHDDEIQSALTAALLASGDR